MGRKENKQIIINNKIMIIIKKKIKYSLNFVIKLR